MAKEQIPRDPITERSLLPHLFVTSVILVMAMGWATYDEMIGRRPWIKYQKNFVPVLKAARTIGLQNAQNELAEVQGTEEYKTAKAKVASACNDDLKKKVADLDSKIAEQKALGLKALESAKYDRADLQAVIYTYEVAIHHSGKRNPKTKAKIDKLTARVEAANDKRDAAEEAAKQLSVQKRALKSSCEKAKADFAPFKAVEVKAARAKASLDNLDQEFTVSIRQVFDLKQHGNGRHLQVDRCQTCHVGVIYPEVALLEDVPNAEETYGYKHPYTAHPTPELIDLHPTEEFGCTYCHRGAGPLINAVHRGHGYYHKTPWPMYPDGMDEAGCVDCHRSQINLDHSKVFVKGKELFRSKGCWGCHKYQGFATWEDETLDLVRSTSEAEKTLDELKDTKEDLTASLESADPSDLEDLQAAIDGYTIQIEAAQTQVGKLHHRADELKTEHKRIGPNLKELAKKLERDWLPIWIENPHRFRPDTKMPNFYLDQKEDEVRAISVYLWQNAYSAGEGQAVKQITPREETAAAKEMVAAGLPKAQDVSADEQAQLNQCSATGEEGVTGACADQILLSAGKTLVRERGCLGCHRIKLEDTIVGDDSFAADITYIGEKANRDYLASWVQHPRAHNAHTVMPDLRLSRGESVAIATYLKSKTLSAEQRASMGYDKYKGLFDQSKEALDELAAIGEERALYYGCTGCHEIKGHENAGRIGTELTFEGSKDVSLLDFGHLTKDFKKAGREKSWEWFKAKLRNPRVFDCLEYEPETGYCTDNRKRETPILRMPNFRLNDEEVNALATFMLGSLDEPRGAGVRDEPKGDRKAVAEGWWLINQYNCTGCHQVEQQGGQFRHMDWYEKKQMAPPILDGEGTRVQPEWLAEFLRSPYIIRPNLDVRMPTFELTDSEATKISKFFAALEKQPVPYVNPELDYVDNQTMAMNPEQKKRAQNTFVQLQCYKCHMITDEVTPGMDRESLAPNLARATDRLRPDWVVRWLINPQSFMPYTSMPAFVTGREPLEQQAAFFAQTMAPVNERKALEPAILFALQNGKKEFNGYPLDVEETYRMMVAFMYTMDQTDAEETMRLYQESIAPPPSADVAPAEEPGAAEPGTEAPEPATEE